MRRLLVLALVAFPSIGFAQEFKIEPPKSPADSLKCIKARPGFTVELMVAEPLVMDPIAFAWGADGKFWVVEMGDYPLGADGKNKFGGKIKYLEKTKPDGPYDKMTLFMDNVGYPTGVFPYGKGILVTCAPDIFYAEMGKDGKVKKEVIFTGFREGNQQHRVNGLVWGIDNWIYGANGDSGGVIEGGKTTGLLNRIMMKGAVNISGRDFRLKVETGEFEAVSGQSQFGRCRDDWGNWFGNNNSNPMFHYVLDDHYLRRNPHVLYPDHRVPVIPGAVRVYPISKPLPRFNSPQALNHFTSACSTIIYRDTLFGKDFEGNMFVSEPVHNLVHREIMKPKGVTFTSQRADDEQTSEFLASSDNWFRPTMIQVGPDGAIWIADMYRYVIEHPEWIPKDWQKKLDLRAGHDLGRIYRVYPTDKKPREIVRMDKMEVKELVRQLESPNGWVRDTAHQLIIENKDTKGFANAAAELHNVGAKSRTAQGRLHAFLAYEELSNASPLLAEMMDDSHPAIRRRAVIFFERYAFPQPSTPAKLLDDPDPQVKMQFAYLLGEWSRGDQWLGKVIYSAREDKYVLAAAMSSVSRKNWKAMFAELTKFEKPSPALIGPLMRMAKVYGEPLDSTQLLVWQLRVHEKLPAVQVQASVGEMLDVMEKNDITLKKLLADANDADIAATVTRLKQIYGQAKNTIADPKSPASEKLIALRLLGRGLGNDNADYKILVSFLTPRTPDDIQSAVIQHLSRNSDPRVPILLLGPWKSYSPALRGQVLDTLFTRAIWTRMTLDAIQKKEILPHEIDAIRRQRLLTHKDAQVRETAVKIFDAASNPERAQVVSLYWLQLPDKTDAARGGKLFAKSCATCHKLGGVGQDVGPDLASVGDKSVQGLLHAILDPNRALESRYINYSATTKAGLSYNGILQAETSTSITLVGPDGKKHQLLRNELDELASTGKSLMPEGFEKDLSPQDMADIIAHVRGNTTSPKNNKFPGNNPQTQVPDKDGIFKLLPTGAAIYGPTIALEMKYGSLTSWKSVDDEVAWRLNVTKPGRHQVWIYYTCAHERAGNLLAVEVGKGRLTYKVPGSGAFEWRGDNIGELQLDAGIQQLVVRSDGRIRGALIDLKKVELAPK